MRGMKKKQKTNVMRLLDQHKISYNSYEYDPDAGMNGIEIAQELGNNPNQVFKTLVTVAENKQNFVFVIPVSEELNLKKAAKAANVKRIRMIKSNRLYSWRMFPYWYEKRISNFF